MALQSYTYKKHWLLADVSFFNCVTHLPRFWGDSNSLSLVNIWEPIHVTRDLSVYPAYASRIFFLPAQLHSLSKQLKFYSSRWFFLPTDLSPTRTSADTVTLGSGCDFSICTPNNIAMQVKVCNTGQGDNF